MIVLLACLRLYAAGIVVAVWAAVWACDVRGDAVIGVGLTFTAVAIFVSERERSRRRRARSG